MKTMNLAARSFCCAHFCALYASLRASKKKARPLSLRNCKSYSQIIESYSQPRRFSPHPALSFQSAPAPPLTIRWSRRTRYNIWVVSPALVAAIRNCMTLSGGNGSQASQAPSGQTRTFDPLIVSWTSRLPTDPSSDERRKFSDRAGRRPPSGILRWNHRDVALTSNLSSSNRSAGTWLALIPLEEARGLQCKRRRI